MDMTAEQLAQRARDELAVARLASREQPLQAFELALRAAHTALRAACLGQGMDFADVQDIEVVALAAPDEAFPPAGKRAAASLAVSAKAWIARGAAGGDMRLALESDLAAASSIVESAAEFVAAGRACGMAAAFR